MNKTVVFLILRIIAALLLAQSLFFKFTGAAGSVDFFSQLSNALMSDASLERVMRMAFGVVELVSVVLLLMKKPVAISVGALLAVGVTMGSIMAYVTVTGINIGGAALFAMALITFVASFAVLFRFRGALPLLGKFT